MEFQIDLTQRAADHIRAFRKFEQRIVLGAMQAQLQHEPTVETRARKHLGENDLSEWELRIQKFRVFYNVVIEEDRGTVKVVAVGHKEHNTLYIGGREVRL
jgi:mRNA-degrading endonuclease RelE of RelBE toxin-antitoxin system